MENDFRGRPSADEAVALLSEMSGDRSALVDGTRVPRVLLAAYGGVAAWWVAGAASASPGKTMNRRPPDGWHWWPC